MPSQPFLSPRRAVIAVALCASLAACSSPTKRAERAVARYGQAYAAGDLRGAKMAMLQAVAQRDDVASYWISLGEVDLKLGDYAGAYDAYSHAAELEPNNVDALHNVAEISLAAKRLADARKYAQKLLAIDRQDVRAQLVLGYAALRQKKYPEALQWADRLLASYPLEDAPLALKAKTLHELGRDAEAIDLIERAIPIRGATRPKLDTLLELYRGTGNDAGVEKTLTRYLALDPENVGIKLQYAAQLYRMGKSPGAENILVPLLEAGQASDQVADVMIEAGGKSPSRELLQRLGSNATNPALAAVIARIALEKGFPDLAMQLVAPFVGGKVTPTVAAAGGLFAAGKLAVGRTDEALAVAERVLSFDKTNSRALEVRGEISLSRRDFNQALSDARLLVSNYPNEPKNRTLLARVYEAQGDMRMAETTLGEAHNDLPANADLLDQYVALLTRQKRFAIATDVALKFTQRNPGLAKGWKTLADVCRAAGDIACVEQSQKAQARLEMAQAPSQAPA